MTGAQILSGTQARAASGRAGAAVVISQHSQGRISAKKVTALSELFTSMKTG